MIGVPSRFGASMRLRHVLELVDDRAEADRVGARVVDEVGRVAADEARLQLLRDLCGGRDLDRAAGVVLLHDLGREVDVVDAVAAVEDHGVDGRPSRPCRTGCPSRSRPSEPARRRCRCCCCCPRRTRGCLRGGRSGRRPGLHARRCGGRMPSSRCSWCCSYLSWVGVSGVPTESVAVAVFEAVVVLVAAGDVGGEVDGRGRAGCRQPTGGADGEQLRDEGCGHRGDRADRDVSRAA